MRKTSVPVAFLNTVLAVVSLIFYAWGEPRYIVLMFISIALNYSCARLISKLQKGNRIAPAKLALMFSVFSNLAILGVFKYTLESIPVTRGSTINKLGIAIDSDKSFHFNPIDAVLYRIEANYYDETFYHYIKTTIDDQNLPRLVMLRDSFTGDEDPDERWGMWRFLSNHFSSAEYFWVTDFDKVKDNIDASKPDVVIIECYELYLYNLL